MPTDPFVTHCLELLSPLGPVRARRMFGGYGLYADDLFVALIAFERLYLKIDDSTREAFLAEGGECFVYDGKGKPITMRYCTPPPEAMDSPALMLPWASRAMQAALAARAATSKPAAPRATRTPRKARRPPPR